jgi:papilin
MQGQGCLGFKYGGCGGNNNRFDTEEECQKTCGLIGQPTCLQPIVPGPCKGSCPRFGFDYEAGKCVEFIYGCCEGNKNNFVTLAECREACGKFIPIPVRYLVMQLIVQPAYSLSLSMAACSGKNL